MRKSILMCFFVFMGPVVVLAEQSQDNAKDMAVIQIYQYAESSYDRGDYTEARHGFEKVLQLDPQNTAAAEHLKKLEPVTKEAKSDESVRTEKIEHSVETFTVAPVSTENTTTQTITTVQSSVQRPVGDDIKELIAAEDRAIGQVNDELARLRATPTETSHE